MKSITIILLSLFIIVSSYAQDKKYLKSDEIPEFILNDVFPEKLVIKNEKVIDSLKVAFKLVVDFDHLLGDTTKCINVKSVEISILLIRSLKTGEKILFSGDKNELKTSYQQYLWDLCAERLNYWFRNQPYNKVYIDEIIGDISYNGDRAYFAGSFFLEPL